MKPAPGKHGSAMIERVAKKVERRNARRASNKELRAEVKASGLGIHQVEHFRSMDALQLAEARTFAQKELYALDGFPVSPARDEKAVKQQAVISYLDKLMKDRR